MLPSPSLSPDATPLGASTPSMMNARQCADFFPPLPLSPPHLLTTGMAPTIQPRSLPQSVSGTSKKPSASRCAEFEERWVAVQRNHSLVSLYPAIQIIWDSSPSHVSTVIMEVQDIHISLLCVVRSENGRNAISEARAQHAPHVFPPPRRVTHTEGIHHALFKLLILPAISGRGRLLPDIEAGTLN